MTRDVLALRGLNMEVAQRAVDWSWALIDADRATDAAFMLCGLTPPFSWPEVNKLIDEAAREMGLPQPADQTEAAHWLAAGHLQDIIESHGEDFRSLKLASRLWFDHQSSDLRDFYALKHEVRAVLGGEAPGNHYPGVTPENWEDVVTRVATTWLAAHPIPDPFQP